ncbi:MAG: histidinol-phosphate aminotransferase family protein [Treponema sp.]|nr:histidinol-phosphate aminotransferase family protein [Candidatus Treponema equifaecale]
MDYKSLLRDTIKVLPESQRAARQPKSSNTTPDIFRLNYNESMYGPSPKAIAALEEASKRPFVYPDWFSVDLKTNFAKLHGLPSMMNVCAGTGSSALISIIGEIFLNQGDEFIVGDPSYEAFRDVANVNGASVVVVPLDSDLQYDLDAMLAAITPKTKALVICNPNNPTGTFTDSAKLEAFIKKVPEHVLVVIDEAYLEFVTKPGTYSMVKLINEGYEKPLIVLKTFSKAYGMAGLRIGLAAAKEELITYLAKSGAAWNISALGQAMAAEALKDQEYLEKIVGLNAIERDKVTKALKEMGCKVYESQTNFILFKADVDSLEIQAKLAEEKVLIGAPRGFCRVSLGTSEMNDKFLKVLKTILGK